MSKQIMVKMVLDAWNAKLKEATAIFDALTDEQLQTEVAPGRNTGIYLLGHLIAEHDRMLPLLNMRERLYPEMDEDFITKADAKKFALTAAELRQRWKNINSIFAEYFTKMPADAWFEKHNSVSAEDFAKEPHRNKLNVIITRTHHMAYHNGQVVFLKH